MSSTARVRVGLVLACFLVLGTGLAAQAQAADKVSRASFHDDMRKLWEDHITWTRLYIVSAVGNLPDKALTAQRLLQNQTDIGNAVKPFYGEAAGDELTALLRDHILIAAALIDAAIANDTAGVEAQTVAWYANADAISEFLSAANPRNWPLEEIKAEMRTHLDLTLEEAVAQIQGNYAASIAFYDEVHHHILHMADFLSSGIIRQFPQKFRS
ncbi:MAG TPA: hypothetical protein VFF17_15605 [Thermoanaerobaculia bacterium]|nr:hypothetical protein [Thermoanaerobaculia bacterium]